MDAGRYVVALSEAKSLSRTLFRHSERSEESQPCAVPVTPREAKSLNRPIRPRPMARDPRPYRVPVTLSAAKGLA